MARQAGNSLEKKMINGLVTEATAFDFPENACTETFDCVFGRTGLVGRRLGFEYEPNAVGPTVSFAAATDAFSSYVWQGAGGSSAKTFLVQQTGNDLYFYDISTDTDVSPNVKDFSIDLTDHQPDSAAFASGFGPCQYAVIDGTLFVANPYTETIAVKYVLLEDDLDVTEVLIKHRDFAGVDDGLALNTRSTSTVADLITNNPEHYYNLLNQGWYVADALAQWDTARSDVPSNADMVAYYRASETDAFDNARVLAASPGNSPAIKGHFIVKAFNIDRPTAITDDGLAGVGTITSEEMIGQGVGAIFGSFSANPASGADAFDGDKSELHAAGNHVLLAAGIRYLGKDFTGSSPFRITKAIMYGTSNVGYNGGGGGSITAKLYGKTGVIPPSSSTDGVEIGTVTFNDAADESGGRTLTSTDTTTFYNYVWIKVVDPQSLAVVELEFYTVGSVDSGGISLEPFTTPARPSAICHMNGRLFYGGVNDSTVGNNIYFSQIIQRPEQYGYCYQQNDPTSEQLADLLEDDGGVIRIPEMAQVCRLWSYRGTVFAFAGNGVWQISGTNEAGFLANNYRVQQISSIGTHSPLSFVDYQGLPVYWSENGIYTLGVDPEKGAFTVQSITDTTIKSFIDEIDDLNLNFVQGTYDAQAELIYWVYNDNDLSAADHATKYKYNKVLVQDTISKSFYPWRIPLGTTSEEIRGVIAVQDTNKNLPRVTKFVTTDDASASTRTLSFSEASNTDYEDWGNDYESYFITGYKVHGDGQRFFQPQYVWVYLQPEEGASCYLQCLFDWTTDDSEGKWSTAQQLYNSALTNRALNHRRLKVRGKGKAMQLKFYSESGCPFTITGWSIHETVSAGV